MSQVDAKLEALLDDAEVALEVGDPDTALVHLEAAIRLEPDAPVAHLMAVDLLLDAGEFERASLILEEARARFADDPDVRIAVAAIAFQAGEVGMAGDALRAVLVEVPDHAGACFWLSQVVERQGDFAEADALLERAATLDPELHHKPVRMQRQAFEQALVEAVEALPPVIAEATKDVPVLVHDLPSDELLAEGALAPDLLGLFVGPNQREESVLDGTPAMPVVYVFQRNIERIARDRQELIDEARITLIHELGHFLGLEEDELHELGLG